MNSFHTEFNFIKLHKTSRYAAYIILCKKKKIIIKLFDTLTLILYYIIISRDILFKYEQLCNNNKVNDKPTEDHHWRR